MKKLKLSQGKFAVVDDEDYEELAKYKWRAQKGGYTFYAVRSSYLKDGKHNVILMHRVILDAPKGMFVDHINGDGLDNRRCNLRLCTHAENIRNSKTRRDNTSGYKGVYLLKHDRKWCACLSVNGVTRHLGRFTTPEAAARAYNEAAEKYYGRFARTNYSLLDIELESKGVVGLLAQKANKKTS
jgi:hypothetical protein